MQFFVKPYPFLKLLSFRILIVLAYQIMEIVVGWHIYELTHDTLALGLVGLAEVIPYFCCALFAGYAVDHHSRRLFGVFACLMLFLTALTLAAVSADWLSDKPSLWIYSSIAFTGVARAFIGPSYSAMFALILPRNQYARASGIGSAVFQFGLVVGPALGGILVGWAGMRTTILQLATPDAMRGRVSAINGIFIGSSNELGAFESGVAARLLGLVPSVIFGGVMTLIVVAATAKLAPKLRRLEISQLQ
jgi:MFS family permease